MWSYITSIFGYFFKLQEDEGREKLLIEELIDLKLELEREEFHNQNIENKVQESSQQSECFQRTGFVTHCGESYILIDGSFYFDTSACSFNLNVNDKILYLGYNNSNEELVIVRILQNEGIGWENEDDSEEQRFDVINHIIVGIVDCREDRNVFIQGGDLKFNLDDVQGTFIPIAGDWLEMQCSIQKNDEKLTDINMTQVLQVTHFRPLRTKIKSGTVTEWSGKVGIIDNQIYFDSSTFIETFIPQVGAKIKYLRLIFNAMGLPQPKIGTVEEFQGQERPIILITTVRSTESLIQQDIKYTLGFVNSPKRLNVAITRAQISMILFCNPHLLSTDSLWNEVIMNAVNNNRYMGCYFPIEEK
ncbi:uncharacterized protein LOC125054413 isoform X2 [Pieris napi]|uniref:uncharacterized protein LOC125054413 isoform X2 n=1 Tax=Pieris napi TaxID=78633 RepID=UPI001FBA6DB3|nr:uncharacterized protein LOC125054413 isoform X2 [Pieris napi]